MVNLRDLCGAFVRLTFSLLGAGICYLGWMAGFLLLGDAGSPVVRLIFWLSAPVATATGFATGIATAERLARTRKTAFFRIFAWPLIGCAIGAGAVYLFGPMLIVFGMFAAGGVSVVLREVVLSSTVTKSSSSTGL